MTIERIDGLPLFAGVRHPILGRAEVGTLLAAGRPTREALSAAGVPDPVSDFVAQADATDPGRLLVEAGEAWRRFSERRGRLDQAWSYSLLVAAVAATLATFGYAAVAPGLRAAQVQVLETATGPTSAWPLIALLTTWVILAGLALLRWNLLPAPLFRSVHQQLLRVLVLQAASAADRAGATLPSSLHAASAFAKGRGLHGKAIAEATRSLASALDRGATSTGADALLSDLGHAVLSGGAEHGAASEVLATLTQLEDHTAEDQQPGHEALIRTLGILAAGLSMGSAALGQLVPYFQLIAAAGGS